MLDRATGKPLYGIPEKPVPQNAEQKTWPTQPIPDERRVHPARPRRRPHDVARVKKQAVGPLAKVPVVVAQGAVHATAARQAPHLRQRPAGRRQLAADLATTRRRR